MCVLDVWVRAVRVGAAAQLGARPHSYGGGCCSTGNGKVAHLQVQGQRHSFGVRPYSCGVGAAAQLGVGPHIIWGWVLQRSWGQSARLRAQLRASSCSMAEGKRPHNTWKAWGSVQDKQDPVCSSRPCGSNGPSVWESWTPPWTPCLGSVWESWTPPWTPCLGSLGLACIGWGVARRVTCAGRDGVHRCAEWGFLWRDSQGLLFVCVKRASSMLFLLFMSRLAVALLDWRPFLVSPLVNPPCSVHVHARVGPQVR